MDRANVLITGATKGIGRAIALRFAQARMNIALTARTAADLADFQKSLQSQHPDIEIVAIAADMGKEADIRKIVKELPPHWKKLDVLVNNAGLFIQDDLLTEPESNLDESLQVNVYGPYRLCRYLLSLLLAGDKGSHIFNICSVASQKAFLNCGSYVISKHALLGLNRALRQELLEKNVKVTAMLPGATWTASWEGADMSPERIMQPEDIAEAVFAAWTLGPSTVVEEMVLRPQLGDL